MAVSIVLCRHTQTNDNLDETYTGQRDIPLNATGEQQAHQLAERIANEVLGIYGVWSSDLQRAAFLAARIGERAGIKPVLTAKLREVDLGAMVCLTKTAALRRYPKERHRTTNPLFNFNDIGGERAEGVMLRHTAILGEAVAQVPPNATIVVVGHGTALRLVFRENLRLIDQLHEQGDYQIVTWPM